MNVKKLIPYGVAAAGACGVGAVVLCLSDFAVKGIAENRKISEMPEEQAQREAAKILEAKCAACHGSNATYNRLVNFVAGGLLKKHVEHAQRTFTLAPNEAVRPAWTNMLKMDRVLATRRMPPASYTAVHWGSALRPDDVAVLRRVFSEEVAEGAFAPVSDAVAPTDAVAQARIRLGHLLFFDGRLSTNNKVSCATCHDLTKGGTDQLPKSEGVPGADGRPQLGGVNAPTVFNAGRHLRLFWDGRAADLKEQAGGPPLNPVEMGYSTPEDWALVAAKLQQDPELVRLFALVYPDQGITGDTITDAIAAFEETLKTPDSAFDRYLKGEKDALTEEQKKGFEAFSSYGCAMCHSGEALGGGSFEFIDTFADFHEEAAPVDYEEGAHGLADFTKKDDHADMFRVPSLRNVALTHPYFHTGTVDSLQEAVRIMFRTQTGASSVGEDTVQAVTRFLEAQTGKLNGKSLSDLKPEDVEPKKERE